MQTNFSPDQLQDPDIAASEKILRKCVHCGFCTATCPTFVLLGDELDSPRGRIYLIKDMLENDKPATKEVVKHIDRCLSCLSCMTTCPSGVHYQHLIDHARAHVEQTYKRPLIERGLRAVLALILPYPGRFRLAMKGAQLARPFRRLFPGRIGAMLNLAPKELPKADDSGRPQVHPAVGERKKRVALLAGCAQQVLAPAINAATIRLLTRLGCEVVVAKGAGCCGALVHHMGKVAPSHAQAIANINAWWQEKEGEGLDAVVINASGCGTQVKDYGFMLRTDPDWADKAEAISAMTLDITEVLAQLAPTFPSPPDRPALRVAYHSACSMQHGQQITDLPKMLLDQAGFTVLSPAEGHLCCGSAGVYNIMQPKIAGQLLERKVANLEATQPQLIATGNIGCLTQIRTGTQLPLVHTVELLDWATGGPMPEALDGMPLSPPQAMPAQAAE